MSLRVNMNKPEILIEGPVLEGLGLSAGLEGRARAVRRECLLPPKFFLEIGFLWQKFEDVIGFFSWTSYSGARLQYKQAG